MVALACTLPVTVVQAAESVKPSPAAVPAGFIPDESKLPEVAVLATYEEVKSVYEEKAKKGDALDQFNLGSMYANGVMTANGVVQDSVEAVKWFRKAAEQGYAPAQQILGLFYHKGVGVDKDKAEGVKWIRKAAEQGYSDAPLILGYMYEAGEGVAANPVEALKWYRKAAELGNAEVQFNLSLKYAKGEGVPQDIVESMKWLRNASDNGFASAQFTLAVMYDNGEGVPKDIAEAEKLYRKAAKQGNAKAQYNLFVMYSKGEDAAKNSVEATKWLREAAIRGFDIAQFRYGMKCFLGDEIVVKDTYYALGWIKKAAEQGLMEAQMMLGSIYFGAAGGIDKNSIEAAKWFLKAAEQGNIKAQLYLGIMYGNGDGLSKDSVEAVKWYRKAAEQGSTGAQGNLGVMYYNGEGVLKDIIEALAWFNLAAISGDAESVNNRDIAEAKVGPQGTLQAQQRSKEIQKLIEAKKSRAAEVKPSSSENSATISAKPKANGSGALVTRTGYILTAAHVVSAAARITVVTSNGEKTARVIRVDEANDLAVLKIEGSSFSALPVAPSRGIKLGQNVATIGFPNVTIQGFSPKLTRGEISSLNGLGDDPRSWQISAPVQPGNSGGPLLDEYGNLIGVIVSKLGMKAAKEIGDMPQNVNYAVKSAYAAALLDSYLGDNAPEPKKPGSKKNFEEMVSEAQKAVVLILVY